MKKKYRKPVLQIIEAETYILAGSQDDLNPQLLLDIDEIEEEGYAD